ncbi:MAG: glucosyl-3-phosphoglycerate synthase [Actinomycetes bacterium]|nr:MAG: glucosyl-3-phosphoglycerate synthase [Actinomycetota bacterium]
MADVPVSSHGAGIAAAQRWLRRRTSKAADWRPERLVAAKGGSRVSVILPARNEEPTVGRIVATIRRELVERLPLVDEVVVVDSHSTDRTGTVAAEAGARVVHQDAVLPELPPLPGKGDAMWKGLAATRGDIVVFIDADLREFGPHFVTGLLGPLLTDPTVSFVKGAYERPLCVDDRLEKGAGGRVTELVARPLINMFWPELAGFVQPLAGEYAGRREVLELVPFVTHYGVELGLLVDLLELVGLDAMAQVDLGYRVHKHQTVPMLGRMAAQIMHTAWSRLERQRRLVATAPPSPALLQFLAEDGAAPVRVCDVRLRERPCLASLRVGARPRGRRAPAAGRIGWA